MLPFDSNCGEELPRVGATVFMVIILLKLRNRLSSIFDILIGGSLNGAGGGVGEGSARAENEFVSQHVMMEREGRAHNAIVAIEALHGRIKAREAQA